MALSVVSMGGLPFSDPLGVSGLGNSSVDRVGSVPSGSP